MLRRLSLNWKFSGLILLGLLGLAAAFGYNASVCSSSIGQHGEDHSGQQERPSHELRNVVINIIGLTEHEPKPAGARTEGGEQRGSNAPPLCETRFTDVLLVLFTYFLVVVGWITVRTGERSVEVLERPYVYVFGAYKLESRKDTDFIPFVRYTVANYGRTPAEIESIEAGLGVGTDGPPTDILKDASTPWRMREPIFAPNRERKFTAQTPDSVVTKDGFNGEISPVLDLEAGHNLYLRVVVKYRGPTRGGYETSACWVRSEMNNRFSEFGGEALNYVR